MTFIHAAEAAVVTVTGSTTLAAVAILQTASATQATELQVLLLPLIGSMIISGGFIMLNPTPETLRVTIGRSMIALFFGVLIPQIIAYIFPSMEALCQKPLILVLFGGLTSGLAYVLARPLAEYLFKRSKGMASDAVDTLINKIPGFGKKDESDG